MARIVAAALLAGCASRAPERMPVPQDAAVVDASDPVRDAQVDSGAAGIVGGDAAIVVVDGSAGAGGSANNSGSPPQRTSQPISLDSDLLGETPREVLARVAGTYGFELAAPIGRISITVPATAATATLMTVRLLRFIEVPLDAQIMLRAGETLRGGKLLINGTRLVAFEMRFDANILPSAFLAAHPEASACDVARIVFGWDGATPSTAGLQLLKTQASPDDPVELCYRESSTL
jgi:hypothetical protein